MTDPRTEAERRYDALALSTRDAAPAPDPEIVVTYLYRDGDLATDLNDEGRGHVVYVEYELDGQEISFRVAERVEMPDARFSRESYDLLDADNIDNIEHDTACMQRLLNDPRVIAERAKWEAKRRKAGAS